MQHIKNGMRDQVSIGILYLFGAQAFIPVTEPGFYHRLKRKGGLAIDFWKQII